MSSWKLADDKLIDTDFTKYVDSWQVVNFITENSNIDIIINEGVQTTVLHE